MRSPTLALATALLVAGVAQPPIGAQETTPEGPEGSAEPLARANDTLFVQESLPFVPASNTIAAKLPIETEWTPANVGVVDLTAITEQNAIVLGDALNNVSGLNVQTGNGVFDFFVIRGFDSISSSLILTDGAPEPETTFYQLYNTERVEVFKGPAGFLYGSNPLAGVVNLVRKQPVPSTFGSLALSLGSHDTREATFDWNQGRHEGRFDSRLNGLYRESAGYRDGRESETSALNPAFTWRLSESTFVNFNFEAMASDFAPDAGLPVMAGEVAEVPRDRSYASPLDFSEQDILRFQIDYQTQVSERLTVRNKTYRRELDWRTNGTLLNGVLRLRPSDLDIFRTLVLLDDVQEITGNQFELTTTLETGSIEHQLLAGIEISRLADDFSLDVAFLPTIGLFNPVETTAEPLFPIPGQSARGDSSADVVAPYVIDQLTISDRVRLLLGARFDSIDFEDRVTGTTRSDSELSPLFGLVVAPTSSVSAYVNAGESFAPPSARVVGEREPEKSRQIELGIRKAFAGGRATSTFAVFEIERDNIPIPDE
ncbi:MAG: TonB-dependent receptor, partial [Acidobacteriota bacterium]|nr:TonB-dependent receptor [Acidobacteriota bacterium]